METFEVNKICRCCLKNNGQMKPLYGFSLDEMLRSLVGLEVEPNDGLPELVCFQCVLQLSRAFRFKLQCQKSNVTMIEFIKTAPAHANDVQSYCEENIDVCSNFDGSDKFDIALNDQKSLFSIENPLDSTTASAEVKITEFKCATCSKVFNTRKQHVRHVKIHDTNKTHKCSECNKTFSQSCNLKKHMLKHNGGLNTCLVSQYQCSVCGKSFKYASSLSKHIKLHTGRNLFYCPSCPKFFLENTTLQNHLRCHTGDRPFVCHCCNKSYTNSSNLKKHVRSHSDKRPFKCNKCGRTFVERNYLTIHMKTHGSEQNALCSKCGKCLANAKSLNAHMRIHTSKRSHRCGFENCDKSFSRPDTAAIHRRTHTGEKLFSCDRCNNWFKTPNQLLKHSSNHIGEKSFACNLCPLSFSSKKILNLHSNQHNCSDSLGPVENQENKHSILQQEEGLKGSLEHQPLLLFKLNENGELVPESECSLITNHLPLSDHHLLFFLFKFTKEILIL